MEQKYYYDATNGYSFDSYVKFFKNLRQKGNAKFVYILREEDLLKGDLNCQIENINKIIELLTKNGIKKDEFIISFLHDKTLKTNSNESCKVLYELEKHFDGYHLGIESGDVTWSSEQIINANKKIEDIVKDVKSKDLSKLEQLFLVYKIITQKIYKEASKDESIYTSREIYGILSSDKIVCVGYVELLKEIISKLDLGNDIKIFSNLVKVQNHNKTEYHENCIIYVKDEKYGIDGYYYFDPTWDCAREGEQKTRLTYFMVPLREVININSLIQTYPIKYADDIEHLTVTYNKIVSYHRPQYTTEVSFGQSRVILTERLTEFLENDKKLRALIGESNAFSNLSIKEIYEKDPKFLFMLLKQRSNIYPIWTTLKLVENVIRKTNPEDTDEMIKQKVMQIYQDNYNIAQKCFYKNTTSSFSLYQNRMAMNNKKIENDTKEILSSIRPNNKEREM